MIVAMSVLLISMMVFQVEAKTFDKSSESRLKGLGLSTFNTDDHGNKLNVQIAPQPDTNDVRVVFDVITRDSNGSQIISYHGDCVGSKTILKVSSTKKASAEFNTSDLSCLVSPPSLTISLTLEGTGEGVTKTREDTTQCSDPDVNGVQQCWRFHGIDTFFQATGTANIPGLSLVVNSAQIVDYNDRYTSWTNP